MSSPPVRPTLARLVRYLAGVGAVFLLLEWCFRANQDVFHAASNRVLTKAALLDRHGAVDVLFFGSSRSWDGVSPRIFCASLGGGLTGFNLAVTSTNLSTLEALADRYAARPGLRLALIEASLPQLDPGASPWDLNQAPARDLDDEVVQVVSKASKLIEDRAAFRAESLERLPSMLFLARSLDGSEVRLLDQLEAFWGRVPDPAAAFETVKPISLAPLPAGAPLDERALRLDRIAEKFRRNGIAVAFFDPPLTDDQPGVTDVKRFLASRWTVWDFSKAEFPRAGFRDPTHLNMLGRAILSRSLAELTRSAGWLGTGAPRTSSRVPRGR